MNSKLLRGLLNAVAIELIIAWAVLSFFVDWAGWCAVAAAGLFLMTGYAWFCEEMRKLHQFRGECDELDRHFADTKAMTQAAVFDGVDDELRALFPDGPRPIWDTEIFGAPD